jgi:branched-chain amino acid transport system ATP-binding protein
MAILRVAGVSKRFGGLVAVRRVTFDVAQGEIVGVIGPNGAGKTTLFDVITGFQSPDEGAVEFDGRPITGLPPHRISHLGMARTFQKIRLFPEMTTVENVMVGALLRTQTIAQARERALAQLAVVGIRDKADELASTLSTGQRKRLELARALALRPVLLLLDEVTGGVDRRGVEEIVPLLRRIRDDGFTILVIEHNVRFIQQISDRVIVLNLGEKLAEGPPHEVFAQRSVIDAYLGRTDADR